MTRPVSFQASSPLSASGNLHRHSRRGALRLAGAGASTLLGVSASGVLFPASAAAATVNVLDPGTIYFEETGHTLSGPFLEFWRRGGLDAFGYPITEPFEEGGVLNQYFQRARFELPPEKDAPVRLGMLGIEVAGIAPAPAAPAGGEGVQVVPETGHTVAGAFGSAYRQWRPLIGPPIGPEEQTGPATYQQYFAHARLEWEPAAGLRRGLLGIEVATQRGVGTSPVPAPANSVLWSDYLGALAADEQERRGFAARVTNGTSFTPAFGQRWVVVNLTQQRVYAYEHLTQKFTDLISSGSREKDVSTRGVFAIARRVANEIMDSSTLGYPVGHPKHYRLENVLYTQYYNGAEALHYAWWHNNFGTPMSYGCINMRLNTARWFWDWASMGTPVIVV